MGRKTERAQSPDLAAALANRPDHHDRDPRDPDEQPHREVALEQLEDLMRHGESLVDEARNGESLRAVPDELALQPRREGVRVRARSERDVATTADEVASEELMRAAPAVEHPVGDHAVARDDRRDRHDTAASRERIAHCQAIADLDAEARGTSLLEEHRV